MASAPSNSWLRRAFQRDTIALIISMAALLVSYLAYRETAGAPRLFLTGDVQVAKNDRHQEVYLCRTEIHNLGNKVASEISVSVSDLVGTDPLVVLSPPVHFKTEIPKGARGGLLYVRFQALGVGDKVLLLVEDKIPDSQMLKRRPLLEPPYFVYASCKEGSDHAIFVGLHDSKTAR